MMKKNLLILGVISGICILSMFYYATYIQPKVTFDAEITDVSKEDYERIINNKQNEERYGIKKFKHVKVSIKVQVPFLYLENIRIVRSKISNLLEDDKNITVLSGGEFEAGNKLEYFENVELSLGKSSIKELKQKIGELKHDVIWGDDSKHLVFYLKDYLK